MDKTVPEWCKARHLSRSTYHKLKNLGRGPKELETPGTRIKRITPSTTRWPPRPPPKPVLPMLFAHSPSQPLQWVVVGDIRINMVGHYVTTNFHLGAGAGGDVSITDPPIVVEQKPGNAAATISGGEELEIRVPDFGKVTFAGPNGALRIDHAATFTGKVAGFGALPDGRMRGPLAWGFLRSARS